MLITSANDLSVLFPQALSAERLEQYEKDIQDILQREMDRLPQEGTVDLFTFAYDLVVRVVLCTFLGPLPEAHLAELSDLWKQTDLEIYLANPLHFLFPILSERRRLACYLRIKELLGEILQDRRSAHTQRMDFLQIADSRLGGPEGLDRVFGAVWSSIFAATTNQFAATAWLMYYSAADSQCRERIGRELAAAGAARTLLCDMPYLEAALREVLRITTPGMAVRWSTEPVSFGPYTIREGRLIVFFHSTFNMDEKTFSDPTAFVPERLMVGGQFDHEQLAREFKILGFGCGRHPCTGMRLATLIIKATFSTLFSHLDYSFPEKVVAPEFQPFGVLRPSKPLLMHYKKRKSAMEF